MPGHGLTSFSLGAIFTMAVELTTHVWVHYFDAGTNFATHLSAAITPAFNAIGMFLDPVTAFLGISYLFKTAAGENDIPIAPANPMGEQATSIEALSGGLDGMGIGF